MQELKIGDLLYPASENPGPKECPACGQVVAPVECFDPSSPTGKRYSFSLHEYPGSCIYYLRARIEALEKKQNA